jgi:hypothetical protein
MPDERREFHKIRPASHTLLSVNCLYQINTAERKGRLQMWFMTRDGGIATRRVLDRKHKVIPRLRSG